MFWETGWRFGGSPWALDCRTVRQRRLTSPLRPARPERKLPTLCCTKALLPRHRSPGRLSCVEIRAVARQVHQPQPQSRRPEIFPHRFATMRRRVVPDHVQRPLMLVPQLFQEGGRGPGVAVSLQVHPLHLAGLQAHRRVVAGLLATAGAGLLHQCRFSPSTHLPRSSASARKWASSAKNILPPVRRTSCVRAAYSATKASRLALICFDQPLLGPLQDKP